MDSKNSTGIAITTIEKDIILKKDQYVSQYFWDNMCKALGINQRVNEIKILKGSKIACCPDLPKEIEQFPGRDKLKEDPKFYHEHKWEDYNPCPYCSTRGMLHYTGQLNDDMFFECRHCGTTFIVNVNSCKLTTYL